MPAEEAKEPYGAVTKVTAKVGISISKEDVSVGPSLRSLKAPSDHLELSLTDRKPNLGSLPQLKPGTSKIARQSPIFL